MIDIPAETTISRYAIPARNLLMRCEASFRLQRKGLLGAHRTAIFIRLIKTEVACVGLYEARHSKIRWPCSSTTNTRFDLQKSPALLNSAARHLAWFIASSGFEKLFPMSSAKSFEPSMM